MTIVVHSVSHLLQQGLQFGIDLSVTLVLCIVSLGHLATVVSSIETFVEVRMIGLQVGFRLLRITLRHVDNLQVLVLAYTPFLGNSTGYNIHYLLVGGFLEVDTAGHKNLHHLLLRRHESCANVAVIHLHGLLIALRLLLACLLHT